LPAVCSVTGLKVIFRYKADRQFGSKSKKWQYGVPELFVLSSPASFYQAPPRIHALLL